MEEEQIKEELEKAREELDKKVDRLTKSFDYYTNLVEDIGNLLKEYEIDDKAVCYSSCITTDENVQEINNLTDDYFDFNLKYIVRVLYENNIYQFRAVDFEKQYTEFNITTFNNDSVIESYKLNSINSVKEDIIKWLISI